MERIMNITKNKMLAFCFQTILINDVFSEEYKNTSVSTHTSCT